MVIFESGMRRNHPRPILTRLVLVLAQSGADERILRDLSRTMPGHPFFKGRGERGQKLIFNVAHAYAVHDSQVRSKPS